MSNTPPDPAGLYRAVQDELIAELRSLDSAAASMTVPSCPEWSVKDVASHLSGLNAELLADLPGSLGSDEATNRQVADRSHLSLDEVIDEWLSLSDPISERFSVDTDKAGALLADMVVHAYDLEEVLHQNTTIAATATPPSAHRYVVRLQQRLAEEVSVALTVELTDGTSWPAPQVDGGSAVTLKTSPYELLRGVTGRLRRTEVEAFDWSADPTEILDQAWNQYGPFRT